MSILKAKTSDGFYVMIDLDKLKTNKLLENANVFKTLFGFNSDSKFGNFDMKMNETNEYITLLEDLNISRNQWYLLHSFLNNGFSPYYNLENYENSLFFKNLEDLNEINIILGGIPAFDKYYKKVYNSIDSNSFYNPKNPNEDYKKKYIWDVYNLNDVFTIKQEFMNNHKSNDKWESISVETIDDKSFIWFRKEKI